MRAQTKGKHEMGKRFAIVIGMAAAGVMALGVQTTAAAPDVVKYDTRQQTTTERGFLYHGWVLSDRDRNRKFPPRRLRSRKCESGRRVVLFKKRPRADRELDVLSEARSGRASG